MPSAKAVLKELLKKLHESQSWCPLCGGEKVHNGDCALEKYWWFTGEFDEDEDED